MGKFLVRGLLIVVLLLVLWMFFACLILPILILVHCAKTALRARAKTIWIVFMLLVWPIGGWLYGLFASKKLFLRWSSGVSLFLSLVFVSYLLIMFPRMFKEEENKGVNIMREFSDLDMPGASQEDIDSLKTAFKTLQTEMSDKKNWLVRFRALERTRNLYGLFEFYARDKQFADSERKDWMDKYKMRYLIDQDVMNQHLGQIKYKH